VIRALLGLLVLLGIGTCAVAVPIGSRTTWQHLQRIWRADETQEMVREVETNAGPLVDKVRRGVEAGVKAATAPDAGPADDRAGRARGTIPDEQRARPDRVRTPR
jgi:hypothetical protein